VNDRPDEIEVFLKLASKLHSPSECSVLNGRIEAHGTENSSGTLEVLVVETQASPDGSYSLNELKVFGLEAKRLGDPSRVGFGIADSFPHPLEGTLLNSEKKALLRAKDFIFTGSDIYRQAQTKIFVTPDDIVATDGYTMLTHHNRGTLPFTASIRMTRLLENLLTPDESLLAVGYQPKGTSNYGDLVSTLALAGAYKGIPYRYYATTTTPEHYYNWKHISTLIRQACGTPIPVESDAFSGWKPAFSHYTGIIGRTPPKYNIPTMTISPPDGILVTPGGYEWGSIQWPFSFKGIFNPYLLNKALSKPGITHVGMADSTNAFVADWLGENTSAYIMPHTTEQGIAIEEP